MQKLFAAHDALIFTSAWGEPFALTPLEAMAADLPVISTLEGGSAELIRHQINALAFRTSDPEDLAEKIMWMVNHPFEIRRMAAEGKREVLAQFDRETMVSKIENYLKGSVARV
jgi:glycosyltransferase involved in cell wall biosynthesis